MQFRRFARLAVFWVAFGCTVGLAGCSSSGGGARPSPSSARANSATARPSPSRSAGLLPAEQAGLEGYLAFARGTATAKLHPTGVTRGVLGRYSAGSALDKIAHDLTHLQALFLTYRGVPPRSRARVLGQDGATGAVTVRDCPVPSVTWRVYSTQSGKALRVITPKVAPPYAVTARVQKTAGVWKVVSYSVDASTTCQP